MENRILKRQLKRLGLDTEHAPDRESWHAFLSRLDKIFVQHDQDQYLLQQSLTTLSKETQELYQNLQQQTESQIELQRDRLQAVMNNVADAIITFDEKGHIESFNYAAERIFGYTAAEILGRKIDILMPSRQMDKQVKNKSGDGTDNLELHTDNLGQANILNIRNEIQGQRWDGSLFPWTWQSAK
jgi:PAS domain S-box-containing protein